VAVHVLPGHDRRPSEIPLLDAEMPTANGVVTARALARMYGVTANGGEIDGIRLLSGELVAGSNRSTDPVAGSKPVCAVGFPPGLPPPYANVMPGFGHVGLGGSVG
jgi:CubicO group peptidase (beta-lactamase class C family)